MANAQSKLDIIIAAKNEASGTINEIKSQSLSLKDAVIGVGTAFGIALGAQAVKSLAETGFEMARESAQAERLNFAFNSLAEQAEQSSDQMLAAMREASRGTIADTDLMADANRAMLLDVAHSGEQMAQLLEVASARGKAMGESTAQAFGDIVTGIGRLSPMILDNLGIVVDAKAANEAYAQSIGTTADKLTEQQQKQALTNAAIKSSTDLINENKAAGGDAADNFERMDAAMTNAKEALGALFAPAMAVIAQDLADAANKVADSLTTTKLEGAQSTMHDLGVEIVNLAKEYQNAKLETDVALLHPEMMDDARQHVENVQKQIAAMGEEYNKAATIAHAPLLDLAQLQQGVVAFGEMAPAIAKAGDEAESTGAKLLNMGADARAAIEQFNLAMSTSRDIAEQIASAGRSAGALFAGKQGADAGLAAQRNVTDELNAQYQIWHNMGYDDKQIAEVILPGMTSQISEANNKLFSAAGHTKELSEAAKEAKAAFENVKSVTESVLKSALDTGTGVDPNKVLEKLGFPREDAINENARRLADIAQNGLKGQDWIGAFRHEAPDMWSMIRLASNPQEEAARLLRDFQDGLSAAPPIDKDKAKQLIERQIRGEQNMAAMAQEIAKEVAADMSIPLQEALAATTGALGGGGAVGKAGTGAADAFGDGMTTQMDSNDTGGAMIDRMIAQTQAAYGKLKIAAAGAAKVWGDEFIATVGTNIPPALVSILVGLVTPGVISSIAQKGTLTGANP